MRVRLELTTRELINSRPEVSMLILVRDSGDELIGLQVDTIEDVIAVNQGMFEPSPLTLSAELRAMVPGAYKMGGRLIMLLSLEPILTLNSRQQSTRGL